LYSLKSFSRFLAVVCTVLIAVSLATGRTVKTHRESARHSTKASTKHTKTVKSRPHTVSASRKRSGSHKKVSKRESTKRSRPVSRGQQSISDERALEIQQALIRVHYLDGQPSGTWDTQTQAAMSRFQNDNGWQRKIVPDSRALIKLGLGPSYADLINPETSVVSGSSSDNSLRVTSEVGSGGGARR